MCIICIVLKINILLSYLKFLLNKKLLYLLSKIIPKQLADTNMKHQTTATATATVADVF